MTHTDTNAAIAATAARRRKIFDPEAAGKAPRTSEIHPVIESELKAALKAAGCGIVRKEGQEPPRDWLRIPPTTPVAPPSLPKLLRTVATRTTTTIAEMQSDSRIPRIVRSRMIFCFAARRLTKKSTIAIGLAVNREHATVMHAIEKVETKRRQFQPELDEILAAFPAPPPEDDTP